MANSEMTKRALADAFCTLAQKMPADKITVGRVTEACGLNRQTFYYHFQDMVDLVEWMLIFQARQTIGGLEEPPSWQQALARVCEYIEKNKALYANLARSQMRGPLERFLFQALYKGLFVYVQVLAEGTKVTEEEQRFLASFYTTALIGMMQKWLEQGGGDVFFTTAHRLEVLMDGSLERGIAKFDSLHAEPEKK